MWIWVISLAVVFAGCGAQHGLLPAEGQGVSAPMVWPEAPERARIRFVKAVARPVDLGIEPSFWQKIGEFFAGKAEEWMIRPTGVAVRGDAVYVADPGAQALWILDAAAGRFKEIRGPRGQRLASPVALALGRGGRLYVADSYLRKILIFDAEGNLTATLDKAPFLRPAGVAYDEAEDRLYVADSAAHRVWVLSGDGAVRGEMGGRGAEAGEFNFPTHVALDRGGTLYVTDSLGFRIQMFGRDGKFLGAFGKHGDASGDFAAPKGVGVDSEGHIYVVDALFDAVQIFNRAGQLLLGFGERGVKPGRFWLPGGLFIDQKDRIYVADSYNQRIQIFQYLAGGDD